MPRNDSARPELPSCGSTPSAVRGREDLAPPASGAFLVLGNAKRNLWRMPFDRNRLEHSPPRPHYFMPRLFLQPPTEARDETRSSANRNGGHLGADRLGGGGERTIWLFSSSTPFCSIYPLSRVQRSKYQSSLPSICPPNP